VGLSRSSRAASLSRREVLNLTNVIASKWQT
jgi:hypothetical protein